MVAWPYSLVSVLSTVLEYGRPGQKPFILRLSYCTVILHGKSSGQPLTRNADHGRQNRQFHLEGLKTIMRRLTRTTCNINLFNSDSRSDVTIESLVRTSPRHEHFLKVMGVHFDQRINLIV